MMARHNYIFCVEEHNINDYSQLLRVCLVKNVADQLRMLQKLHIGAGLAELVYALVLGTSGAIHRSSSLLPCTNLSKLKVFLKLLFFTELFRSEIKIS